MKLPKVRFAEFFYTLFAGFLWNYLLIGILSLTLGNANP